MGSAISAVPSVPGVPNAAGCCGGRSKTESNTDASVEKDILGHSAKYALQTGADRFSKEWNMRSASDMVVWHLDGEEIALKNEDASDEQKVKAVDCNDGFVIFTVKGKALTVKDGKLILADVNADKVI
jgi:hypothetical protein